MSKKMTVAEHLQETHKAMSAHHDRMAKFAKASDDEDAQAEHEKMSAHHSSMAEKCQNMASKAAGDEMEKRLVTDQVRSVYANLTPVTRKGQPSMAGAETPNVPTEFEHLVKVEDE